MPPVDRLLARDEHVHLVSREHEVVLVGPFLRACIVLTACSYTAVRVAATGVPLPLRLLAVGVLGLSRSARSSGWPAPSAAGSGGCSSSPTGGRSSCTAGSRGASPRLPLDAIHDIEVVRARPGWMLHYGGLVVSTGGRRDLLFGLRRLPDPDLLLGSCSASRTTPEPSAPPRWRLTPGGVPVTAG